MASGLRHTLLPLLGFAHGGLPGAAVGVAADRGLSAISNANNARKATELFYGPQPKRPVHPWFAIANGPRHQAMMVQINQARRSK